MSINKALNLRGRYNTHGDYSTYISPSNSYVNESRIPKLEAIVLSLSLSSSHPPTWTPGDFPIPKLQVMALLKSLSPFLTVQNSKIKLTNFKPRSHHHSEHISKGVPHAHSYFLLLCRMLACSGLFSMALTYCHV